MRPNRALLTTFDFVSAGYSGENITRAKLDNGLSIQVNYVNETAFTAIVAVKSSPVVREYTISKAVVGKAPNGNKLRFWMWVAVTVVVIQVLLWLLFKACRSSVTSRIDDMRENMVIDLDSYGDHLKQLKQKKD